MDGDQLRSKIASLYVILGSTRDEEKCMEIRTEISELTSELESTSEIN